MSDAAGSHANTSVTTTVPDITVEEISGIQVPNANEIININRLADTAISIPPKTRE